MNAVYNILLHETQLNENKKSECYQVRGDNGNIISLEGSDSRKKLKAHIEQTIRILPTIQSLDKGRLLFNS